MIAGVEEAGRGPVLGPMVICGVLFEERALGQLKAAGVKDSKLISPKRRETLANFISGKAIKSEIIELSPARIDELRLVKRVNLNEIEAMYFARVLDALKPDIGYIDSVEANTERFKQMILRNMKCRPKLVVENCAERKYVVVAAASVVAKVRRDQRVAELQKKYGTFGSGYSSDPRTISFLKRWVHEHGKLPEFARKSWETAQRIEDEAKQRTLSFK